MHVMCSPDGGGLAGGCPAQSDSVHARAQGQVVTGLGLASDLGGPDLDTEVLVQVVHHPGLDHGQAELVVASPGPQPHREADGL